MTGYNKIFLDTTPLIYFLDSDVRFGEKTKSILEEVLSSGKTIISSAVTCEEYLVYPYRTDNSEKADVFFEFTDACGIELVAISVEIAKQAAMIRAEYKDFKAMDALQLAVAMHTDCDLFLTNDKQLRQFKDLCCVTVEEWELSQEVD